MNYVEAVHIIALPENHSDELVVTAARLVLNAGTGDQGAEIAAGKALIDVRERQWRVDIAKALTNDKLIELGILLRRKH